MREFIDSKREQTYLLPVDIQEWLKDDHLARFLVNIIWELDLYKIYEK